MIPKGLRVKTLAEGHRSLLEGSKLSESLRSTLPTLYIELPFLPGKISPIQVLRSLLVMRPNKLGRILLQRAIAYLTIHDVESYTSWRKKQEMIERRPLIGDLTKD